MTFLDERRAYWCEHCNVPLIQPECDACGSSGRRLGRGKLRPVFREEIQLVKSICPEAAELPESDLVLWADGRTYYFRGQPVAIVQGGGPDAVRYEPVGASRGLLDTIDCGNEGINEVVGRIRSANATALRLLEAEAMGFVVETCRNYQDLQPMVSYSGGKDSGVVSHLVRRALGRNNIPHVFADTTIELPETYRHMEEFRVELPEVPLITARPPVDFFVMARAIGPPSRVLRWCCTSHKTGPITKLLRDFGNVLTFCGIRRSESRIRSRVPRISLDTKVLVQVAANPVLDWSTTDIWLYTLTRWVLFNPGYRYGFHRIGCYVCPCNSPWSDLVGRSLHPDLYQSWLDLVARFARESGLPSPDGYAESGAWKGRFGARGHERARLSDVSEHQCLTDGQRCGYTLRVGWRETFVELLKPLGRVVSLHDDGYVAELALLDPHSAVPIANLIVSRPRGHVTVQYTSPSVRRKLEALIRAQVRKAQACVGCGGCSSFCPTGALKVIEGGYSIDEQACTHCLQCIRKMRAGCLSAHSARA